MVILIRSWISRKLQKRRVSNRTQVETVQECRKVEDIVGVGPGKERRNSLLLRENSLLYVRAKAGKIICNVSSGTLAA